MASAVHCQLNPQVRPFVPMVMASKLAYRRRKREGGEEPVSKHQIRSGDGRWAGRGGTVEPTSRDQNTRQERGQGKGKNRKSYKEEEIIGAKTEAARQSRAALPATKQSEHVHVDGRSQLPRTTSGRWRWMGCTELDGR